MKRLCSAVALLLSFLLVTNTALPCTTFVLQGKGRVYFGRNLDWSWEDGLVVVNPRNLQKVSFLLTQDSPARWTSKYGSVTFNQFGREMPFGGMNEAGLVVENMQLVGSQYAPTDSRAAINLLQWIQYQLDNCRTVTEVLSTDEKLRIEPPPASAEAMARIHYLVGDASGDCAVIEFLDGKMVSHHGTGLPCRALANNTYDSSLAYARAHPGPNESGKRENVRESLQRFSRAASRVAAFHASTPEKDLQYAFDTLQEVSQGDFTVWRMVYDLPQRKIHFQTRSNPQVRTLDLKALDFSCVRPVQFVDIQSKPSASGVFQFRELSEASHRNYLEKFFTQDSLKREMGDLTPMMQGLLLTLHAFSCVDSPVQR